MSSESKLPRGFHDKEWSMDPWGYYEANKEQQSTSTKKCDCGAWKAYGKNCDAVLHYNWCEILKNDNL